MGRKSAAALAESVPNVETAPPVNVESNEPAVKAKGPKKYELKEENCYKLHYVEFHQPLRFGQETRNSLDVGGTTTIKNPKIYWDFVHNVIFVKVDNKPRPYLIGWANVRHAHPE